MKFKIIASVIIVAILFIAVVVAKRSPSTTEYNSDGSNTTENQNNYQQ